MKKLALVLAVTSVATTFAADAFALDAYKDRRGIFFGLNLGGGMGFSGVDEATDITGLSDGQPGLQLGGEIGGGMSKAFTGALEMNWWYRKVRLGERKLNHHHLSLMPTLRYFIFDGLHAGAGAGFAYASFDTERLGRETYSYRETGVAVKAEAGYEFFLNGTIAAGVDLSYTHHFYSHANFDTVGMVVTVRWY